MANASSDWRSRTRGDYYRDSLKPDPRFADAFTGLGARRHAGRIGEAFAFEQALEIELSMRRLSPPLATCLKKREKHDRAEEVYTQGLLLDIRHEELWLSAWTTCSWPHGMKMRCS